MSRVAVIGATTWGNTLGRLLADKGAMVSVWTRTEAKADELRQECDGNLSKEVSTGCPSFTANIADALHAAEFVICAVPAQRMRQNMKLSNPHLNASMILISVAKGLEAETGKRMSEVIADEAAPVSQNMICALSGPNLSGEINQGLPATSVVAGWDMEVNKKVQELLDSPKFSIFVSDDIIGVELCGALKNVIALGAGIMDGLDIGNNAKAAFITLGWSEIVTLGAALGAKPGTFYGLAGLGDLIATGNSSLSRNHYVGYELGKGRLLSDIISSMSHVAEGVDTAIAAHGLANRLKLETPIINLIYSVLFKSLPPTEISRRFKNGLKPESIL
ncbi:MAG: NAD(P)-dependent glycerol-3-phosphate dehydrogenase [Dehalococcoidia bacterium]|nr:NAD(P)-dependent glycerol-3-phosphate dehydrogenase [Dehalococcoidia bacterium]